MNIGESWRDAGTMFRVDTRVAGGVAGLLNNIINFGKRSRSNLILEPNFVSFGFIKFLSAKFKFSCFESNFRIFSDGRY